jgi:hypothetical protein
MKQLIYFVLFISAFLNADDNKSKNDQVNSENASSSTNQPKDIKRKKISNRHRHIDSTAFADEEKTIEKMYKDIVLVDLEEKTKNKKGLICSRGPEYADYIHSFSDNSSSRFSFDFENDWKSKCTFDVHVRNREENQPTDGFKSALAREDGPMFANEIAVNHTKAKERLFTYDENRLSQLKEKIKDYERKVQHILPGQLGYYNNQLKKSLEEAKRAKIESEDSLKNKEEQFAQFLAVAFPAHLPYLEKNLETITRNIRAAIKHQEILDDCLNLHMLEDEIQFSEAMFKVNNQIINKTKRLDIEHEIAEIETYSLEDLKSSRIEYENRLKDIRQLDAQVRSVVSTKESEIQLLTADLANGWRWLNPLAKSTSALEAELEKLQEERKEALIRSQQLQYELSLYEHIEKGTKELLKDHDTLNYQALAQELYNNHTVVLSDEDLKSPLIQAVRTAVQTHNKSCIKNYFVKSRTREVLQHFDHKPIAYMKFDGDVAQQFIYKSIVDSLNKLSFVNIKEKKVSEVVEYALKFKDESIKLTKQHKLSQAIDAQRALDSLIDCAVVLSDVVVAFGEGVLDSCENNAEMAMHIGVVAGELTTNQRAFGRRLEKVYNKATLALTSFFTTVANDMRETLSARSEAELIALAHKRKSRGEAFDETLNKIADLPLRDKARIAGTIFGDIITFECAGSFFKYLGKAAPLEKTVTLLERIVESPMRAVAEEVVEITAQTANKDPKLVQHILKFAQNESEFINAGEKVSQKAVEFIEHLETKNTRYKTLSTGEKCRITYPLDVCAREVEWPIQKYQEIRVMTDDVQIIAKNTGMRESKIKRIKKHLFYDDHILEGNRIGKLDPDCEIAAAWDRLYRGDFIKNDIKLLEHEFFESRYEKMYKTTLRQAHEATQKPKGRPWDIPK